MNEHILKWIEAYADGELPAERRAQVETHLAGCSDCREALAEIRGLSALLQSSPLPLAEHPGRAAAGVVRRLPPRPARFRAQAARAAWRFAPVGLFAGWAFVQGILWVSAGLLVSLRFVPGLNELAGAWTPSTQLALGGLVSALLGPVIGLADLEAVTIFGLLSLGFTFVMTMLFAGWLASYWSIDKQARANLFD